MIGTTVETRVAFILALVVSLWTSAGAQFRPGRPEPQMQQFTYYQPLVLFSPDSNRCRVDIPVRIDQSFFVAVRNTDTSFHYEFRRRGELLVELADSVSGTVARDLSEIMIGAESDELNPEPHRWYEALFSFDVKPGTYIVNFDLTDLESRRNFNDRSRRVYARIPRNDSLSVTSPLFVQWPDSGASAHQYAPVNFGGDLLFGPAAGLVLQVHGRGASDSTLTVRYTVKSVNPSRRESQEIAISDSMTVPVIRNRRLVPDLDRHLYTLADGRATDPPLIVVPFPAQRLPLRTYLLTLTVAGTSGAAHETTPFRMVWPDMPQSLKDVDYALDILRYIAPPATLDSLKSGDFEQRRDNLERFWKPRDSTPGTAYNEVMTEYYRRVDHARRTFGTLRAADGAATDRGRIYILYGPPSRTRRTLNPSTVFEEIWVYDRLKKEFTFVDRNRNGNYTLVAPSQP